MKFCIRKVVSRLRNQSKIAKFSNIMDVNENGWSPLHYACENGNLKTVKQLVKKGAKIDAYGDCGYTPMHWAAQNGHRDVVAFLLEKGSDLVSACDTWGYTPLHKAARFGHKEIVELLVKHGANVSQKSKSGWTPSHLAIMNGHDAVVNALIKSGARRLDLVQFADRWCPNVNCVHRKIASNLYIVDMKQME